MNFAGESCHNINILTLLADSGESEPCAAFFVLSGRKTAGFYLMADQGNSETGSHHSCG